MTEIKLKAKTARKARTEIASRWPHLNVEYKGYDKHGECVLMSLVRAQGVKGNVATCTKNRSLPAVKFVAEIPE